MVSTIRPGVGMCRISDSTAAIVRVICPSVLEENALNFILSLNVISYIAFKDWIVVKSRRKWGHSFTSSWIVNSWVEAVRWSLASLVHIIRQLTKPDQH